MKAIEFLLNTHMSSVSGKKINIKHYDIILKKIKGRTFDYLKSKIIKIYYKKLIHRLRYILLYEYSN